MASNSENITMSSLIQKVKDSSKANAATWLQDMHPNSGSKRSYLHIVQKSFTEYQKLNKNKSRKDFHSNLDSFMNRKVEFPEFNPTSQNKSKTFQHQADENTYQDVSKALAAELWETKNKNLSLEGEVSELKKSRTPKSKVQELKETVKIFKRKVKVLNDRISVKNSELRRVRLQNSRARNKVVMLEEKILNLESSLQSKDNEMSKVEEEVMDTSNNLRELQEERDWLSDIVHASGENVNFFDKDEKKYSAEIRECIYELLSLHVSAKRCADVIRCVLKLVNKKTDKLPSASTIQNMNVERLILSQKQLSEQMPTKSNLTLYTDETTKFGVKYSGYHASDCEGNMYVLGLRQLVTKSGHDTLSTFKEILNDIDDRVDGSDIVSQKILVNITATMSDRASTELKFNSLLEDFRAQILPDVIDKWESLSVENQTAVSKLLNFFCGLHSLIHFAEAANKAVQAVEQGFFEGKPPCFDIKYGNKSESAATRLVRTASKALARGCDEKSGKYKDFCIFVEQCLKENGFHSLPLEAFHGNRFNILFENSASVFFLHNEIKDFLEGNQTNNLLKAVYHDIKIPEFLAGVKALGLISRHITGPLWSILEDKDIHILDMNRKYLELVTYFSDATNDIEAFMSGELHLFGDPTLVKRDRITDCLRKQWEHDDKVTVYLNVVLPALSKLSRKIFRDHLPGGLWEGSSEEVREKCKSTQKHNKYSESVFGYLDQLLRKNPNISVLSSEAYVMFTANRTKEWLDSKGNEEVEKLLRHAMKSVNSVRKEFKRRKEEICQRHKAALEEKIKLAEEKERNRLQKLEEYTNKIIFYGLWQTEEDVDSALSSLTKITEKKEALKAQLNFRKHLLKQNPSGTEYGNVFSFSKKGLDGKSKVFDVEQLKVNVKKLVQHAFSVKNDGEMECDNNEPILVGKRVKHKFLVETDEQWWRGKVVSQVPGYPAWFNIVYDQDQAVYTYQLMVDYREGNLKINFE